MTKQEATQALAEGKRLRHSSFMEGEWMQAHEGEYIFEDGIKCPRAEFWRFRTESWWGTGWSLVTPRDELVCGKLDKMVEALQALDRVDLVELAEAIRKD